MYLITWITTHLPTPEGWMAELVSCVRILHATYTLRFNRHFAGGHGLADSPLTVIIIFYTLSSIDPKG